MSSSSKKMNVSGPKTRKTLQDVRRPSQDGSSTIEASHDGSPVLNPKFSIAYCTFSREGSTNDPNLSEDDMSNDSDISNACTEDMETNQQEARSPTPISPEMHSSVDTSKTTSSQRFPTPKTPSHSPRQPSVTRDENVSSSVHMFPNMAIPLAIFFVLIAFFIFRKGTEPTKAAGCEKFHNLEQHYRRVDQTLWDVLETNVHRATAEERRREPGTVLFLHDGSTITMNGFMSRVTNITSGCLGGAEPILLNGKYFERADIQEDYGVFLAQHVEALRRQGVMVVRNLQEVPAKAAPAFHSICDTEEPLVKRAVIFLTLDTSKTPTRVASGKRTATAEAEYLLHEMWKGDLAPEILDPLIIRLTENVYRIL